MSNRTRIGMSRRDFLVRSGQVLALALLGGCSPAIRDRAGDRRSDCRERSSPGDVVADNGAVSYPPGSKSGRKNRANAAGRVSRADAD